MGQPLHNATVILIRRDEDVDIEAEEGLVKIKGEDGHLQAQSRDLRMDPAQLHLDLGLPTYRTLRNIFLLFRLPTVVHCCGSPSRPEEGAFGNCSSLFAASGPSLERHPLQFPRKVVGCLWCVASPSGRALLCPPPPNPLGSRESATPYSPLLGVVHLWPIGSTHLWLGSLQHSD